MSFFVTLTKFATAAIRRSHQDGTFRGAPTYAVQRGMERIGKFHSEADDLSEFLLARDKDEPGWDRPADLAACNSALRRGTSRALLLSIYGEEIVKEVEAESAAHEVRVE